jgi:hypothetical protein
VLCRQPPKANAIPKPLLRHRRRCLFSTADAEFAGSDHLTMIGLSLRKAAIVVERN